MSVWLLHCRASPILTDDQVEQRHEVEIWVMGWLVSVGGSAGPQYSPVAFCSEEAVLVPKGSSGMLAGHRIEEWCSQPLGFQ